MQMPRPGSAHRSSVGFRRIQGAAQRWAEAIRDIWQAPLRRPCTVLHPRPNIRLRPNDRTLERSGLPTIDRPSFPCGAVAVKGHDGCGELDPAGTSNSMNVRLTEAEIHAVQRLAVPL
jgi:hypothetical protein